MEAWFKEFTPVLVTQFQEMPNPFYPTKKSMPAYSLLQNNYKIFINFTKEINCEQKFIQKENKNDGTLRGGGGLGLIGWNRNGVRVGHGSDRRVTEAQRGSVDANAEDWNSLFVEKSVEDVRVRRLSSYAGGGGGGQPNHLSVSLFADCKNIMLKYIISSLDSSGGTCLVRSFILCGTRTTY